MAHRAFAEIHAGPFLAYLGVLRVFVNCSVWLCASFASMGVSDFGSNLLLAVLHPANGTNPHDFDAWSSRRRTRSVTTVAQ